MKIDYSILNEFTQTIVPDNNFTGVSDEKLLQLLTELYKFLETSPTMRAVNECKNMPYKQIYQHRFGSWNNALTLANIPLNRVINGTINTAKKVKHPICKNCEKDNERPTAEFCSEICRLEYGNSKKTKKQVEIQEYKASKYATINSSARNAMKYYAPTKECYNCGYDKHVEVAHIKAIADFSDNSLLSEINAKDNLVYLCPNCHWEFDNNLLSL